MKNHCGQREQLEQMALWGNRLGSATERDHHEKQAKGRARGAFRKDAGDSVTDICKPGENVHSHQGEVWKVKREVDAIKLYHCNATLASFMLS